LICLGSNFSEIEHASSYGIGVKTATAKNVGQKSGYDRRLAGWPKNTRRLSTNGAVPSLRESRQDVALSRVRKLTSAAGEIGANQLYPSTGSSSRGVGQFRGQSCQMVFWRFGWFWRRDIHIKGKDNVTDTGWTNPLRRQPKLSERNQSFLSKNNISVDQSIAI